MSFHVGRRHYIRVVLLSNHVQVNPWRVRRHPGFKANGSAVCVQQTSVINTFHYLILSQKPVFRKMLTLGVAVDSNQSPGSRRRLNNYWTTNVTLKLSKSLVLAHEEVNLIVDLLNR